MYQSCREVNSGISWTGCVGFSLLAQWRLNLAEERAESNKSLHRVNLHRNFTWKRCFIWIIKRETFAYLKGEIGSVRNWKWGHPSIHPRLYQSCMINNQRNPHFPACMRPNTSHPAALCRQSAFLFAWCFITFSCFIDDHWRVSASTVRLWWRGPNGGNAFITYRRVCETSNCWMCSTDTST